MTLTAIIFLLYNATRENRGPVDRSLYLYDKVGINSCLKPQKKVNYLRYVIRCVVLS